MQMHAWHVYSQKTKHSLIHARGLLLSSRFLRMRIPRKIEASGPGDLDSLGQPIAISWRKSHSVLICSCIIWKFPKSGTAFEALRSKVYKKSYTIWLSGYYSKRVRHNQEEHQAKIWEKSSLCYDSISSAHQSGHGHKILQAKPFYVPFT